MLLGIVFLGNYVAGFSGHEPLLVFAVGLLPFSLILLGLILFVITFIVLASAQLMLRRMERQAGAK